MTEPTKLTLQQRLDAITATDLSDDAKADLKKELYQKEYGAKSFDLDEFEGLLSRLEGSKMRQQRQKSVEGRRDIFSQGMAGMMSNFQQMMIPEEQEGVDQGFSLDGFTGLLTRLQESKDRQVKKSKITGRQDPTPPLSALS